MVSYEEFESMRDAYYAEQERRETAEERVRELEDELQELRARMEGLEK